MMIKVYGANMGPTWVLSAPDGPHVGPMNVAMRGLSASANPVWVVDEYVIAFEINPANLSAGDRQNRSKTFYAIISREK